MTVQSSESLAPDTRSEVTIASVRDVASHAGVSVGTVSNVLNHPEKVLPDTVTRVLAAIDTLGFIRNDAARQLRAGRSKTLGLVVFDASNPFFSAIARGAENAAGAAGLSVLLGNSDDDHAREAAYLDLFEEQRVRGVLITPLGDISERLETLRSRRIPTVLVDRIADGGAISSVSVDDVAGGRLAVEHLIRRGRTRIAYLASSFQIRQVTDRLEGARQAVRAHPGVTLEVVTIDALTVIAGRDAGRRLLERDERDRPDGIFTVNDLIAVGVMQALVVGGNVRIPEQIALIGYDDIDFASAAIVPLSSIRQPSELIGRTAVEIMLEESESLELEPRHVVFQPELVVRESTG